MTRLTLRIAASALFAATTLSQGGAALADSPAERPRVKEIDFEEDYVLGELAVPEFMKTAAAEQDALTTLVRARADFVAELRKSVEDL